MASMSTPVQHLPQQAAPATAKLDEDPVVTDVIQEMEMEFAHKAPAAAPNVTHVAAPVPAYPSPVVVSPISKEPTGWIHTDSAKRAALVAVIALVLFYPQDLSPLYGRAPFLARLGDHDRLVRAVFLALILYVLFWKLDF
jgi:hypothetical protein